MVESQKNGKNRIKNLLGLNKPSVDKIIQKILENLHEINSYVSKLEVSIEDFEEKIKFIEKNIKIIKEDFTRKTSTGVNLCNDILLKSERILNSLKEYEQSKEDYYQQYAKKLFDTLYSIVPVYSIEIDKLPYEDAGITIMGLILTFFPIVQIISIPMGGYLLIRSDDQKLRELL
ncbi:MAG: hypothetical protein ACTSPQ_13385 [Candidatus Helarchaeota archaeon]